MAFLREPTEAVSWEQVKAVVPAEAAAFEAALADNDMERNWFCQRWEDDCPEDVLAAWERLSQRFDVATGLGLYPCCRYRDEYDERPDVGFHVVGAWQLSPAGKRFFGIEDGGEERGASRSLSNGQKET